MRIIISPAKKMKIDTDSLDISGLPLFLKKAQRLKTAMEGMSKDALKALWKCNDRIAERSFRQLFEMDLERNLTPAILSFEGIQYQFMAPGVFDVNQYEYIGRHLRILSGFYGLLRPFDGVVPYRLEMQARLAVEHYRDLYHYWGDDLARQLARESDLILNLASKEYSKAVSEHLPQGVRFLTCTFGEIQKGKVAQKGTLLKMARGRMVRWLAENSITRPEDIRSFGELNYRFSPEHSTRSDMVFLTRP